MLEPTSGIGSIIAAVSDIYKNIINKNIHIYSNELDESVL